MTPPRIVLDTNVVFDWLVFRDPRCAALDVAIRRGHVQWLAAPSLRDECQHVLARGVAAAWLPDLALIWGTWDAHATMLAEPSAPHHGPLARCSDRDDQKFIDLARQHRARWLLTRDRAVLKLARHARALDLAILRPEDWASAIAASTAHTGTAS